MCLSPKFAVIWDGYPYIDGYRAPKILERVCSKTAAIIFLREMAAEMSHWEKENPRPSGGLYGENCAVWAERRIDAGYTVAKAKYDLASQKARGF